MSYVRVSVLAAGLWTAAITMGCGKAEPQAANQEPVSPGVTLSGTVSPIADQAGATANSAAAAGSTAGPVSGTGSPTLGATAGGSPASGPAIGSATSGPAIGSVTGGPTVAAPATTSAASTGPAVTGSVSPQAASSAVAVPMPSTPVPGNTATPAATTAPGLTTAPGATAASANAVASGNTIGLAAAVNQWRAKGVNLVGVKRVADKPVIAGYSWMVHLLPYLGHDELYGKFDFNKDWHDKANLVQVCQVIPAFIDPGNPNVQVKVVGIKNAVGPAFTHFVGMSGVEDSRNLVAATLPRSDPRAGIFGYDQIARPEEITDGSGNTIMIIAAGKIVGPWASGGGATIRGARAPYFDAITGFGSVSDPGAGAVVAMADGSVKRISKDIDPTVFRALCTIHGSESIDFSAHGNAIRPQ